MRRLCEFSEKQTFKTSKAQIVGISGDSVEKQKEFVEKQKLTVRIDSTSLLQVSKLTFTHRSQYPVLSDVKGEARKAYHVGKGLLGFVDARVTFIIDAKGVVRCVCNAYELLIPACRLLTL